MVLVGRRRTTDSRTRRRLVLARGAGMWRRGRVEARHRPRVTTREGEVRTTRTRKEARTRIRTRRGRTRAASRSSSSSRKHQQRSLQAASWSLSECGRFYIY